MAAAIVNGPVLVRVMLPMLVVTGAKEFKGSEGLEIFRKPFDTAKLVARIEALAKKEGP